MLAPIQSRITPNDQRQKKTTIVPTMLRMTSTVSLLWSRLSLMVSVQPGEHRPDRLGCIQIAVTLAVAETTFNRNDGTFGRFDSIVTTRIDDIRTRRGYLNSLLRVRHHAPDVWNRAVARG